MKINSLSSDKHKYLQIVSTIANMPETFYTIGQVPMHRVVTVAIVGTRQPTLYGKQVTFDLAYKLAKRGIIIMSGLAYGIDSVAHTAALEAGGVTLAVMAHGLDTVYPKGHCQLAQRIIDSGGALLSEYPEGTAVMKHQFLARNRLVSGLADAVIVVEAGKRSGTLATVMYALEQGKEVFAVPGNITSPQAYGPNRLIQQGAHPVTCVEDILAVIAPQLLQTPDTAPSGENSAQTAILDLLSQGVSRADELQRHTHLDASQFMQTLTELEINGLIRRLGGNQWALSS